MAGKVSIRKWWYMVELGGLEPPTSSLAKEALSQLSYSPMTRNQVSGFREGR